MRIAEAAGEPCCNCGSREIVIEPASLVGACARCSPKVIAERRWNERLAKAAAVAMRTPAAGAYAAQPSAAKVSPASWNSAPPAPPSPPFPPPRLFGRLPRRTPLAARVAPGRPRQFEFPGF